MQAGVHVYSGHCGALPGGAAGQHEDLLGAEQRHRQRRYRRHHHLLQPVCQARQGETTWFSSAFKLACKMWYSISLAPRNPHLPPTLHPLVQTWQLRLGCPQQQVAICRHIQQVQGLVCPCVVEPTRLRQSCTVNEAPRPAAGEQAGAAAARRERASSVVDFVQLQQSQEENEHLPTLVL